MNCFSIDYAAIGKRIRETRIERKLTQQDLAEQIERSPSFVGHIERGTRKLSLETFCCIVQVLDCSASYLLGVGSEEKQHLLDARHLLKLAAELAESKRFL